MGKNIMICDDAAFMIMMLGNIYGMNLLVVHCTHLKNV